MLKRTMPRRSRRRAPIESSWSYCSSGTWTHAIGRRTQYKTGWIRTGPIDFRCDQRRAQRALLRLRLERRELGIAAQRHDSHLARAVDRHDNEQPAVALAQGDVADFGAAHRQIEQGPGVAA